jgi:cob(I)alamin adenosyltransferase
MSSHKPTYALTKIRTGMGDKGTTFFRGHTSYPKHHLNIEYLGALDHIQSMADFPSLVQDTVFVLGAHHHSPNSEEYENKVNAIIEDLITAIENLVDISPPLKGFVRTTTQNRPLMELRAIVRKTELLACKLFHVHGELHVTQHIKVLNLLSDFIFLYMLQLYPPGDTWNGIAP